MRPTTAFLVAGLVVTAACAADDVTKITPLPSNDADGLILVVTYPDHVEAVAVDPLDRTREIFFPSAGRKRVGLVVLLLERSLQALELEPGPLNLLTVGGRGWPGGRDWPEAEGIYESAIVDGAQTDWTPGTIMPPWLKSHRIEASALGACNFAPVDFDVVSYNLDTKADGIWAAKLDDRTALLATSAGTYYRVTPKGVTPAEVRGDIQPSAMYQAPDQTIWVAGRQGVWRASPSDLEFTQTGPGSAEGYFLDLEGPTDPTAPFELFGIGPRGQVEHYVNDTWTSVGPAIRTDNADIQWLAPGEAVVVREARHAVQWIRDGEVTTEIPFADSKMGLNTITRFPPYDAVAGTREGFVLAKQGGVWRDLGSPLLDRVFEILPEENTFIVAGVGGIVARYAPPYGFCEETLASSHIVHLVPMAGGYLAVLSNRDSWDAEPGQESRFQTAVSWLFPR